MANFTPSTINAELQKQLGKDRNVNSLPHLNKVVINYRVPEASSSPEALENALNEITVITGQKPQLIRAKKSIASFKLRKGEPLAYKVTLRGRRMYDFIDRLFNLVLPQLRDFKGMSPQAFDQQGNYNLVIKDQTYFPEIDLDKVSRIRSVQVTLNMSASSKDEAKMLLSALGFPFKKPE